MVDCGQLHVGRQRLDRVLLQNSYGTDGAGFDSRSRKGGTCYPNLRVFGGQVPSAVKIRLFRMGRHLCRNMPNVQETVGTVGSAFLYEVMAESMWRAMRWACDARSNAVTDTLKSAARWWWQSTQAPKVFGAFWVGVSWSGTADMRFEKHVVVVASRSVIGTQADVQIGEHRKANLRL